jgi:hypothetical protein
MIFGYNLELIVEADLLHIVSYQEAGLARRGNGNGSRRCWWPYIP